MKSHVRGLCDHRGISAEVTERLAPEWLGDRSGKTSQDFGVERLLCGIPVKFKQVQGLGPEKRGEAMLCH
jgi:hypothetical protein